MNYLVLDTEATSQYPETAEVLSVAIIDSAGVVLLDTLVRPVRETSWPAAQRIHGIRPADVLRPELPTLAELTPRIADIIRDQEVVIYSASYDSTILSKAFALGPPAAVHCAMLAFAEHEEVREWNDYYSNWRWHKLTSAAYHVGHEWRGKAHDALADCYAARDVWGWLTDPAARAQLAAAKAERVLQQDVDYYLGRVAMYERESNQKRDQELDRINRRRLEPLLGVSFACPPALRAKESAEVFSDELTGYPVDVWNNYGKKLKLPRYGRPGDEPIPKHLVARDDVYFLRPAWEPNDSYQFIKSPPDAIQPAALHHRYWNLGNAFDMRPLFNVRKLVLGVDYVPRTRDYPEGCYSKTALMRQFKLKERQVLQLRPAFLHVSQRYDDYLLYPFSKSDEKDIFTDGGSS